MKRDMDLIRQILLRFEELDQSRAGKKSLAVEGYNEAQISLHVEIMVEAGLLHHSVTKIEPTFMTRFDNGYRPTMEGYDLLDATRDPDVWAKTKKGALSAGGFTIDLLKDLAKGFVKMQIEERTGVKL